MAQSKYLKQNGEVIYPYTISQNILDVENILAWKKYGTVSGNENYEITDIWDQATEFYIVVSRYQFASSQTTNNPVYELTCHALKCQLEDDFTSSYNTGKIVFVPAAGRVQPTAANTWGALFRFHYATSTNKHYIQLNELFTASGTNNYASSGYYIVYWR